MSELLKWLPWIAVSLLPGLINLGVAYKQLAEDCKFLPFFEPLKTPGVWLWAIGQIVLPSWFFWMMFSLKLQPEINLDLIGKAIGFGLGFIAIMNAKIDTGLFTPVDIKTLYASFVRLGYSLIAIKENVRTSLFWFDVEQEELIRITDLTGVLNILESYFQTDVSLSKEQRENRQKELEEARNKSEALEKVKAIVVLIKTVRRTDLPQLLERERFGFSDEFMKKYFEKK